MSLSLRSESSKAPNKGEQNRRRNLAEQYVSFLIVKVRSNTQTLYTEEDLGPLEEVTLPNKEMTDIVFDAEESLANQLPRCAYSRTVIVEKTEESLKRSAQDITINNGVLDLDIFESLEYDGTGDSKQHAHFVQQLVYGELSSHTFADGTRITDKRNLYMLVFLPEGVISGARAAEVTDACSCGAGQMTFYNNDKEIFDQNAGLHLFLHEVSD